MSNRALKFIDSHTHIHRILSRVNESTSDFPKLEKEITNVSSEYSSIPHAFVNVFCDPIYLKDSIELIKYEKIYGTFGIHPHCAKDYNKKIEKQLIECISLKKCVAWGECGLDYYYNNSEKQVQIDCFTRQLQLAVQYKKPVVIHSRDAFEDTLEIMVKNLPSDWKIHFHCFTYEGKVGIDISEKLQKNFKNLYFGFTGAITFKKSDALRQVLNHIPLDRILLETDAPYMAPGKYRGGICHPGMIPVIAMTICDVKQLNFSDVIHKTFENTKQLYGIE
eukprot:gene11342-4510_t